MAGGGSLIRQAMRRPDLVRRALRFGVAQGYRSMFNMVRTVSSQWMPTGYSAAGTVLEVGVEASEFSAGERVACAGGGYANHAEVIAVPRNLTVKAPAELSFREAAFARSAPLPCRACGGPSPRSARQSSSWAPA